MLSFVYEVYGFTKKTMEKNNFGNSNTGFTALGNSAVFRRIFKIEKSPPTPSLTKEGERFDLINKIKFFMSRTKSKFNFKFDLRSKKTWYNIFKFLLIGLGIGLVAILVLFAWFSKDLPNPANVVRRDGFTSRIYDRNGTLIYDVYKDAKRKPIVWTEVPEYLKKATIAVEDKDFYKHSGFDPLTPFRIIKNIFYFKKITGGSTLTQQLVKNVLLTSEVSITRKIKEFILAVQIEAKYKKDDILLMYLNEAPYGGKAWGAGAASEQ